MKVLRFPTMSLPLAFTINYMERINQMRSALPLPVLLCNLQIWSPRTIGVTIQHAEASISSQTICGMYARTIEIALTSDNKPQIKNMSSRIRTNNSIRSREMPRHLSQIQRIRNALTKEASNANEEHQTFLKRIQRKC